MTAKRLPSFRWIKLNVSYLDDRDYMQLSEAAAGVYTKLYLLAGRGDMGGLIGTNGVIFSLKDIAWHFRQSSERINTYLEELKGAGLIAPAGDGYCIVRFMDEQGTEDDARREQWRIAQQKYRAKALGLSELEQEQDKEKEIELEQSKSKRRESYDDDSPSYDKEHNRRFSAAAADLSDDDILLLWYEITGRKGYRGEKRKAVIDGLRAWKGSDPLSQRIRECNEIFIEHIANTRRQQYHLRTLLGLIPYPRLEEYKQELGITYGEYPVYK